MPFKVVNLATGHAFTVADGETVLDAAIRQGIPLPYGCRSGTCGSCQVTLVSGDVRYEQAASALEDLPANNALLCQARPASDLQIQAAELSAVEDIEVKRLRCKVARMEQLAHDVMRMYLKLPDDERLQFMAGQYIDFILDDGRRRAFSLANAPHDDALLELHVRNIDAGEYTGFIFNNLKEKDLLRIEGPQGSFYLREDSRRPIILLAGGTGFAPVKGIIEHALAEGIARPMHLFWGARARRDLYLHELAAGWAQLANFRYTPVLSEPLPQDDWQGATGLVHEAVVAAYPDLADYDVYASGPPAMVAAAYSAFVDCGLPPAHYYSDAFEFAADSRAANESAS
jgi:CDP-4-dehydro-6-deoxyglucose reductase